MTDKLTDDFIIQEFVPKEVFETFGTKSTWFLDIRVAYICQFLRDYFDKELIINDWFWGGAYNNSGFRLGNTEVGASMSQHKYGRAADIKIAGVTTQEAHHVITDNWIELRRIGLTTLERADKTPTWTHLDLRYTGMNSVFFV